MAQLLNNIYGHKTQLEKLLSAVEDRHLPHALLFTGPSGIGRRKVAEALAQSFLCEKEHPACGKCSSCISVEQKKSLHVLYIQPDGLYIKVDSIRRINQFLSLQSFAPARLIIIDSAHQMNLQAANSLLKILEEPPSHVYFILISSHLSALPVTIRSRVQTLRFFPLKPADMYKTIQSADLKNGKENISVKPGMQKKIQAPSFDLKERWMVKASQGSMDELEKWQENKSVREQAFQLLAMAVSGEELSPFVEIADLVKKREQALFVCLCWQQILRDACIKKLHGTNIIHQDQKNILNILQKIPFAVLEIIFQKTVQLEKDLKGHADSPLAFDNLFMQIKDLLFKVNSKERKCGQTYILI